MRVKNHGQSKLKPNVEKSRHSGVSGTASYLARGTFSRISSPLLKLRRDRVQMSILRFNPRLVPPQPFLRRAGFASRSYLNKHPRSLSPGRPPPRYYDYPQKQSTVQKQSKDVSPQLNATETPPSAEAVSHALRDINPADNDLLAPVHIPEDQNAILTANHPATQILANSAIVVQRKLELMNVLVGFEQANRYTIMDPQGNHLGYIVERDLGVGNMAARQMFSTHRSFTAHVFDKDGKEVLRVGIIRQTKIYGCADSHIVSSTIFLDILQDRSL